MTPIADMVAEMLSTGIPPEAIILAVRTAELVAANSVCPVESAESPVDKTTERRRAYDRERKRLEREVRGKSAESADCPKEAITLLESNNTKKVRARKHPIPPEWLPTERIYELAAAMNIPRSAVDAKAEDMRIWGQSSGALKADWGATLMGFLRKDVDKLRVVPSSKDSGSPPQFYASFTSKEREAWDDFAKSSGRGSYPVDKAGGWHFPTQWPPGYEKQE